MSLATGCVCYLMLASLTVTDLKLISTDALSQECALLNSSLVSLFIHVFCSSNVLAGICSVMFPQLLTSVLYTLFVVQLAASY